MFFLFLMLCACSSLVSQPITWGAPTNLSTTGVNSSDPQIVIDTSGNITVAWVEGGRIKSSTYTGTWSGLTTISSGTNSSSPRLGIDLAGDVTAAWLDNGLVKVARKPFGGVWSAATNLTIIGTASGLDMAVRGNDDAVVTWVGASQISATMRVSGTWNLTPTTFVTLTSSNVPHISIGNGTAIIVWHAVVSGADVIASSTAPIGGSWGSPKTVAQAPASYNYNYPRAVMDASGNATAIWFSSNTSGSDSINVYLLTSTLTNGASAWATPLVISDQTAQSLLDPVNFEKRIGADNVGNLVALWNSSSDGATYNVHSSAKLITGSWADTISVVSNNVYGFKGDLSVNGYGNALAALAVSSGTSSTIVSSQSDFTGAGLNNWSAYQTISSGAKNAYPRVASYASSTTVKAGVAWINGDSGNTIIQAAVGSKTILPPPTSPAVSQGSTNFGGFIDYFNTLTWTASTSPNIVEYIVYRNGIQIAQLDASTVAFIDHNQVQNGSVTYGIVAVDHTLSESIVVTISFP